MSEEKAPYSDFPRVRVCPTCGTALGMCDASVPDAAARVTGFDPAAEFYARLRETGFPKIATAQAYHEGLLAFEALALEIEAWEDKLFAA
jgi:hypothetical protein